MFVKVLINSPFFKKLTTLTSGTVLAQLLNFLIQPIFARLFLPEEFSLVIIINSVIAIGGVLSTGRLEQLILKEGEQRRSHLLTAITFLIVSTLVFFIISIGFYFYQPFENIKLLGEFIFLVPLGTMSTGLISIFTCHLIVLNSYKQISILKIVQVFLLLLFNFLAYFFMKNSFGLVVSQILTIFITSLVYIIVSSRYDKMFYLGFNLKESISNIKKHKNYPLYLGFPSILESVNSQLPVFIISKMFNISIVSFYGFAHRATTVPSKILRTSLYQLFIQKLSETRDIKKQKIMMAKLFVTLIFLSLIIFLPIFIYGEFLFSFIFGTKWIMSGTIAKYLALSIILKLASGPISASFVIHNRLRLLSIFNLFNSMFMISVSFFCFLEKTNFYTFLKIFVLSECFIYSIFAYLSFSIVKKPSEKAIK